MTTVVCDGKWLMADRKVNLTLPIKRQYKANGSDLKEIYYEGDKVFVVDKYPFKTYNVKCYGFSGMGNVLDKIQKHWSKKQPLETLLEIVSGNDTSSLLMVTINNEVIKVEVKHGKVTDAIVNDFPVAIGSGKTSFNAYQKLFNLTGKDLFQMAIYADNHSSERSGNYIEIHSDKPEIKTMQFQKLTAIKLKKQLVVPEEL